MGANTTLNTKEITKCTLRFYDTDFVKKLNDLYKRVGGTKTSFLGMLVREGYKSIAPMYENIDVPVPESVKGVQEVTSKIVHINVSRNIHFHIDINKFVCKRFAELEKARLPVS